MQENRLHSESVSDLSGQELLQKCLLPLDKQLMQLSHSLAKVSVCTTVKEMIGDSDDLTMLRTALLGLELRRIARIICQKEDCVEEERFLIKEGIRLNPCNGAGNAETCPEKHYSSVCLSFIDADDAERRVSNHRLFIFWVFLEKVSVCTTVKEMIGDSDDLTMLRTALLGLELRRIARLICQKEECVEEERFLINEGIRLNPCHGAGNAETCPEKHYSSVCLSFIDADDAERRVVHVLPQPVLSKETRKKGDCPTLQEYLRIAKEAVFANAEGRLEEAPEDAVNLVDAAIKFQIMSVRWNSCVKLSHEPTCSTYKEGVSVVYNHVRLQHIVRRYLDQAELGKYLPLGDASTGDLSVLDGKREKALLLEASHLPLVVDFSTPEDPRVLGSGLEEGTKDHFNRSFESFQSRIYYKKSVHGPFWQRLFYINSEKAWTFSTFLLLAKCDILKITPEENWPYKFGKKLCKFSFSSPIQFPTIRSVNEFVIFLPVQVVVVVVLADEEEKGEDLFCFTGTELHRKDNAELLHPPPKVRGTWSLPVTSEE
ncbi:unnamed protein product [Notodromas monacha]|uniref:Uncharacterized protein n=1 Tax=Notodromas monacha TaxID=399045 RepID=A0A7R9BCX1_9CRUS|nr:unnamed protein product [Notodromas monacha]CAG0912353.1 unnamed protein product [Notodromas monacha]